MALLFTFVSFIKVYWLGFLFTNNRSWLFTWGESGFLGWVCVAHRINETLLGGGGTPAPLGFCHRHHCCRQLSPAAQRSVLCYPCQVGAPGGTAVLVALRVQAVRQPPGGREKDRLLPSSLLEPGKELRWHPPPHTLGARTARKCFSLGVTKSEVTTGECQSLWRGLYIPNISSLQLCRLSHDEKIKGKLAGCPELEP